MADFPDMKYRVQYHGKTPDILHADAGTGAGWYWRDTGRSTHPWHGPYKSEDEASVIGHPRGTPSGRTGPRKK